MSPKLFVSAFQGIKTYFINNTMEEGKLRDAAHKYVDTQTSFANMLIDNTITAVSYTHLTLPTKRIV